MKNKPEVQFAETGNRQGDTPAWKPVDLHRFLKQAAGAIAVSLLCSGFAAAQGNSPTQLRRFIDQQVGGIDKLTVPPDDASIPVPPEDPARPGRYQTTEAKRYLGKLLFHDPVRTARVNISTGVPVDLPEGTAFGGTVKASEPNIQRIVDATRQTGSCGSCHIGEAATKAGERINFSVGGEGRGYTDEDRNFFPRRRARSILTKVRAAPIFAGDALVDALPTLSDVVSVDGQQDVTTPARYHHEPLPPSGRSA